MRLNDKDWSQRVGDRAAEALGKNGLLKTEELNKAAETISMETFILLVSDDRPRPVVDPDPHPVSSGVRQKPSAWQRLQDVLKSGLGGSFLIFLIGCDLIRQAITGKIESLYSRRFQMTEWQVAALGVCLLVGSLVSGIAHVRRKKRIKP